MDRDYRAPLPEVRVVFENPRHNAYRWLEWLRRNFGWTWQQSERHYPKEVALAREWKAQYTKEYYHSRYKLGKRRSLKIQNQADWTTICDMRTRYSRALKRRDSVEDLPYLREFNILYQRCYVLDKEKRKLHPEINPYSLGMDPRYRDWPSGRISYPLHYMPKRGGRLK